MLEYHKDEWNYLALARHRKMSVLAKALSQWMILLEWYTNLSLDAMAFSPSELLHYILILVKLPSSNLRIAIEVTPVTL